MERIKQLAESYMNGCMTAQEFALNAAADLTRLNEADTETIAFLFAYGELPTRIEQ